MLCIEESTWLVLFGTPPVIPRPHSDLTPGTLCPSLVTPLNTLLRQRGQRSVALNHYVLARPQQTIPWYSLLSSQL